MATESLTLLLPPAYAARDGNGSGQAAGNRTEKTATDHQ
jgi:hypothetical protein